MSRPTGRGLPLLGESSARPTAMIVHDPVAAGSFTVFDLHHPASIERSLLFRANPDPELYAAQHRALVDVLRREVDVVLELSSIVGDHPSFSQAARNPNQVFTRDSLVTIPWIPDGYISARMREPLRRPEARCMEEAARRLGLKEIVRLPSGLFLEGGDVIPFARGNRRTLLVGHGPRSTFSAARFLCEELVPRWVDEVIAVALAPWRMNLDGGLVPVADDVVVADCSSLFETSILDATGIRPVRLLELLEDLGVRVIDATREESVALQACNCVCLGERRVVYYDLCSRVRRLLVEHDVEPLLVPGSELVKGRGGPRCMTRPIYGALPTHAAIGPT